MNSREFIFEFAKLAPAGSGEIFGYPKPELPVEVACRRSTIAIDDRSNFNHPE